MTVCAASSGPQKAGTLHPRPEQTPPRPERLTPATADTGGPADSTWHQRAACLGQPIGIFFIEKGVDSGQYTAARRICATCPVRQSCLDDALTHEAKIASGHRYGIYGGLTPRQRNRILQRRTS